MANNQEQKSIKEQILEKIKSGKVKMRPRAHFILKTVLIAGSALLILGFIIFLISFIHFHLRASGVWYLPGFGFRGFLIYLRLLPWLLIFTSLILIFILEILSRHFAFVWRRPIFYFLLAIILIAVIGGFIIERTPFHPNLLLQAREGRLLLMGPVYREFGMPRFHDVHRGVVEEVIENGFKIRTFDDQLLTAILVREANFLLKREIRHGDSVEREIKQGDSVVVMGERENDTVRAFGILKINDEFRRFERRLIRPPMELRR